ncbi:MAG: hypothetical protein DRH04_08355 [Deltaproteobacteria bacterium]|nr:MAG: hypothetical protein DRH04_08355 [Deltaproteobacteria bacterium]
MNFTLASLTLPEGLYWSDKYDWTPVKQSVEILLTGTLLIEEAAQLAGREITLIGGRNYCWALQSAIDSIYALTQTAALEMTLDLAADGIYQVMWRRDVTPLTAKQFSIYSEPDDDTLYSIDKLCFIEV